MDDSGIKQFEYTFHVELLKALDMMSMKIAENIMKATKTKVSVRAGSRGMESMSNELIIDANAPQSIVNSVSKVDSKDAAAFIANALRETIKSNKK